QAEDGIRDFHVTGVQTCALPIFPPTSTPTSSLLTPRTAPFSVSVVVVVTGGSHGLAPGVLDWRDRTIEPCPSPPWLVGASSSSEIGRASCRERRDGAGVRAAAAR